eukprot:TRINITY_DN25484_c0_g1_i1.p1 TRINITY_DN25484_c0_g1~~TRINITY_DN25484_c0_g1_i1.p1  ORF type:complete len:1094 (+),score=199.07 TRINITY_DN25484_c0_g1_i1:223-3504(+)
MLKEGEFQSSSPQYVRMQSEPSCSAPGPQSDRIFDELPRATVVDVVRPDLNDISHIQLVYTIEVEYKQFKWQLVKKASQVLYLHFALKKRAIIQELHEKQEQVKEWLQSIGVGEHTAVTEGHEYDGHDEVVPSQQEDHHANKLSDVPSIAALSVIRRTIGRLQHEKSKSAMQGYLNHFMSNLDIVNSEEVCKFLEVSKLSFLPEYGPKLREDYVYVRHLPKINKEEGSTRCSCFSLICCCFNQNWQKVWAVLKPGFLAFLADPRDPTLLDIIVFDVLSPSDGNGDGQILLAQFSKERNPLWHGFMVACGNRTVKIRTKGTDKAKDWVAAINDAGLRPPEGWCHPNRFGSFAPPRGLTSDGSAVQWFIDGKAAFEAIASAIAEAKSEIFIAGWWICPELYLRRPFNLNAASRLDTLLESKAKQGVQIYVLMYKEVTLALKINSLYSKRRLLNIHENVKVLRYPDHFSTGVYLWSHHEKIVIVDYEVCFLGGLDLCFGRYDTPDHSLGDFPSQIWPGKDYYNPRELEPNSWEDTWRDGLDRQRLPRMPWHDVHCAVWGPPCRDVARHFVQRWNYAKKNKAPNEHALPLLMPHHHMVIPHYISGETKSDARKESQDISVDAQSENNSLTASSLRSIPFLHTRTDNEQNRAVFHLKANVADKRSLFNARKSYERCPLETQMKDFVNDEDIEFYKDLGEHESSQWKHSVSQREWWEMQERNGQVVSTEEIGQVGPRTSCRCQVVRSVGQWSAGTSKVEESIHTAYCSLIEKAEHFIYIENQFFISGLNDDETIQNRVSQALYERIMRAYNENQCFRVIIVIPLLPGFQGGVDDAGAASVRAIMHWQYRTICRGKNSLLEKLEGNLGAKVCNYISFYSLRNYGRLYADGPIVTSQIYVHSKIMIIDDRSVLIGSANINDRSLLGSRDSEIAILLEDKEHINSFMNHQPWKAGRFSHSLRLSLWLEHLGLHLSEVHYIKDPVSEETYTHIWRETAEMNTAVYQDVFGCIPNDMIISRHAFRQEVFRQREKVGYATIDLGITPNKLEDYQNGCYQAADAYERLSKTCKGHLVSFPLQFMLNEDLRPVFNESEYYASPQIFH